ncbi:hypothetical protein VHA01S_004_00350 [Vibrio halioticoli NBRC 102217]|uniref:Methyl-accepting chemotaxis protein n=1 Tax=Vibrio halioticoli NBRC 102217 TaxID=1219072 RepID=V5FEI7_9VIBR|nr:DUF4391 domain-containing protein [Vibrio halioticoli]GAD88261.1 hypothetical protein VHA01S_004_00350 [Vibrio halioticoli NBRC 102217]
MNIENSFTETVIQNFGFPASTELGVKVPKKTITDNTSLTSNDKQLIKDVLKSLVWRFTMKPETVNIPVFEGGVHQYKEIAVLHVKVKSNSKTKQLCKLLHQQIPYPTLLFVDWEQEVAISLADKLVNQADSTKLTIEHQYDTGWLDKKNQQTFYSEFLSDLRFDHCSVLSLYDFYTSVIQKLNFLEAAKTTGIYSDKAEEDLTPLLAELNGLETQLTQIRNKIKKETQMNTKMRLNVEARKIKLAIEEIKRQIA